jgi:hypothetical protein
MKQVIPENIVWVCDACEDKVEGQPRPKHWSELILKRDQYDMLDNAAADGTVHLALCQPCSERLATFVNNMKQRHEKSST